MRRNLAYLLYVLMHKWYVYRAGRKIGLSWKAALLHDLSKFLPSEWPDYVRTFYTEDGQKQFEPTIGFKLAVHHHKRRNPHHWDYWERDAGAWPFQMPRRYVIEMVADWAGAGRVKTGSWDLLHWYTERQYFMEFHPDTKLLVEQYMKKLGRLL